MPLAGICRGCDLGLAAALSRRAMAREVAHHFEMLTGYGLRYIFLLFGHQRASGVPQREPLSAPVFRGYGSRIGRAARRQQPTDQHAEKEVRRCDLENM